MSDPTLRALLNRIESQHFEHLSADATKDAVAAAVCAFLISGWLFPARTLCF